MYVLLALGAAALVSVFAAEEAVVGDFTKSVNWERIV